MTYHYTWRDRSGTVEASSWGDAREAAIDALPELTEFADPALCVWPASEMQPKRKDQLK